MKIKGKIYKNSKSNELFLVGEGNFLVYSPTIKNSKNLEEYVSLNFGEYRLHIDKKDFLNFAKKLLTKDDK